MSIGYACIALGVPWTDQKSCVMKNATEERLQEVLSSNLDALEHIIRYNIDNHIEMFRISSELIPFGSSPVNSLPWWDIYSERFERIGNLIKKSGMRVSMHAGHYTVLNSPGGDVVDRAILDLNYHTRVLDCFGIGSEHKIVLHVGGVYNEKEQAIARFISNYQKLDDSVKKRLVLENDDKSYHVMDVLAISEVIKTPIIFDNLHNKIKQSPVDMDEIYWLEECKKTWRPEDGRQKIHYSQQNPNKNTGSHSDTIGIQEFMGFYDRVDREDIDIMLEVKDKNISALKCIHCTIPELHHNSVLEEWRKYQYTVLEKSPEIYHNILHLLESDPFENPILIYQLIEEALPMESNKKNEVQGLDSAWDCVRDLVTDKEWMKYLKEMEQFKVDKISLQRMKGSLYRMALKYHQMDLLYSYYFVL